MSRRRNGTAGFTLVEMLVVVAIIGILTSIALPMFSGREGKAYDARVAEDTRNAATSQEAYFMDKLQYSNDCTSLPGYTPSSGIVFTECTGDSASFRLTADHPSATRTCTWDSGGDPVMFCSPK